MKTARFIFAALVAAVCVSVSANAQSYEPKEAWPYVYRDFTKGTVTLVTGETSETEFNVPVPATKLHYIEDGKIMEADIATIKNVVIGSDKYINAMGKLMKVLAEDKNGYVLSLIDPDTEAMGKVNIGYGIASSTASAQNVTVLLESGASEMLNMRYETIRERGDGGKVIPTKTRTYLMVGFTLVEATKYEVTQGSGVEKAALNKYFKESKTKWKDADSLLKLVDFIAENK